MFGSIILHIFKLLRANLAHHLVSKLFDTQADTGEEDDGSEGTKGDYRLTNN